MNRSCGESCAKNASMEIVAATPDAYAAIADLNRTAFGTDAEGALIARLRDDGLVLVERVALDADGLVGHILFSRLDVEIDGRKVSSAALAPMAVRPDRHRQGIGSRLVQDGLAELRSVGCEAVIVLGHPGYYPRFGFSAALTAKLNAPFKGEAFMAIALMPGALDGHAGSVTYPDAFRIVQNS
jgi:putative acetyltransferase